MPTKELLTDRDDIFVIRNFFSDEYCAKMLARSEEAGFGEAPINTFGGGTVVNKDVRNNERVIIDDFSLASEVWQQLEPFVSSIVTARTKPVGLNERFRFYRYEPGQYFDWHFDGAFRRPNYMEMSHLTFMAYLNGDFTGGTTDFNLNVGVIRDSDPVLTVVPEKGMALVFTHHVLHRGAPVTSGRKYVMRSDVMYQPIGVS